MYSDLPQALEKAFDDIEHHADFIKEQLDELAESDEPDVDRFCSNASDSVQEIKDALECARDEADAFASGFTEIPALNGHGKLIYKTDSVAMETIMEGFEDILRKVSPSELIAILNILR